MGRKEENGTPHQDRETRRPKRNYQKSQATFLPETGQDERSLHAWFVSFFMYISAKFRMLPLLIAQWFA